MPETITDESSEKIMNEGHCLCGAVRWSLSAEPFAIYNCHCRMCQKSHGAAFGTYAFVKADQFRWLGDNSSVVHYRSSETLTRCFCGKCGSVVPYPDDSGDTWVAPAGCHDFMRKPDYNIFVEDNAPWHIISGDLPECSEYPEESGLPAVKGLSAPVKTSGHGSGSCLCGAVTYRLHAPMTIAHNCHCSRCRHGRAAAHATNGFVGVDDLEYLTGEDHLQSYKVPEARSFTQVFCEVCSSLMPRKNPAAGVAVVPLSSLDDDPGIRPVDHIFVDDKAPWHDITDDLPQLPKAP